MKLIDIGGDDGLQAVVVGGPGQHKWSILGLFLVVEIDGAEVDAGAAFQRGEESGGDVGAHPVGHPIQFITGHEAAILVHCLID